MKTFKYFTVALIALTFLFACEPEEEIVPDIKVNQNIMPINLESNSIFLENDKRLSVELNWEGNLQNQVDYVIERSANDSTHWKEIAMLDKNATSFLDTELTEDSLFFYRIKTIPKGKTPTYSNLTYFFMRQITPNAPSNLVDSAVPGSSDKINLNWQDNSNNEAGFMIERSLDRTTWTSVKSVEKDVTTFQDSGLEAATKYYYRVKAFNYSNWGFAVQISPASNIAEAVTNLSAPNQVTAEAQGPTRIRVRWSYAYQDKDARIVLQRSLNSSTWQTVVRLGTQANTYTDINRAEETTYYYRLFVEKGTTSSSYSQMVNATTFLNSCLEIGSTHNQSFTFTEGCELEGVVITGNIDMINGTLRLINCTINGDINQYGSGHVEVIKKTDKEGHQSKITGNITEKGDGSISITDSRIKGQINEFGSGNIQIREKSHIGPDVASTLAMTYVVNEQENGDILIENSTVYSHIGEKGEGNISIIDCGEFSGQIKGDIGEQDSGSIKIINSKVTTLKIGETLSGDIELVDSFINTITNFNTTFLGANPGLTEQGKGSVKISGSKVRANIAENGYGNIDIKEGSEIGSGSFPGNVAEASFGNVYLRDTSIIWGNLAESGTGKVYFFDNSDMTQIKGNLASD